MANYEVTITDGVGSRTMNLGTYTVSATSAPGYNLSILTPTSYTVDATHNIYPGVFMVSMDAQMQTKYVQNTPITSLQNFTLTDANYNDLPINSATLSFAENA